MIVVMIMIMVPFAISIVPGHLFLARRGCEVLGRDGGLRNGRRYCRGRSSRIIDGELIVDALYAGSAIGGIGGLQCYIGSGDIAGKSDDAIGHGDFDVGGTGGVVGVELGLNRCG